MVYQEGAIRLYKIGIDVDLEDNLLFTLCDQGIVSYGRPRQPSGYPSSAAEIGAP